MKAAYQTAYGPSEKVRIRNVPRPDIGANDLLVQVFASTVTTADWRLRASAFPSPMMWLPARLMFGLFRPKVRTGGMEFAGRVVAKGEGVTQFKGGDAVFGMVSGGAHAEYLVVAQGGVVTAKPENVGFDQAAAVPFGALCALVFLRDFAKLRPGQKVLIHGASGGVGVFAVQLAKHFGAEVTAVASAENVDLLLGLGADHAIDYRTTDFTKGAARYDLVFDTVGKTRYRDVKSVLTATGIYLPLEFGLPEIAQSLLTAKSKGKRVMIGVSGDNREDLIYLADLLARGVIRSVIDSHYTLDSIAEAHRRVETRHKRGSVVVAITPEAKGQAAVA